MRRETWIYIISTADLFHVSHPLCKSLWLVLRGAGEKRGKEVEKNTRKIAKSWARFFHNRTPEEAITSINLTKAPSGHAVKKLLSSRDHLGVRSVTACRWHRFDLCYAFWSRWLFGTHCGPFSLCVSAVCTDLLVDSPFAVNCRLWPGQNV